jgi:hypothetical protein
VNSIGSGTPCVEDGSLIIDIESYVKQGDRISVGIRDMVLAAFLVNGFC